MRSIFALGSALTLVLVAGCKDDAPPAPVAPPSTGPTPSLALGKAPASIVFTSYGKESQREVLAALEDGSRAPVRLSRPDTVSSFAAALPGRRVLVAAHAADGAIAALDDVSVDGSDRRELGAWPAGRWKKVLQAKADGDAAALVLTRADAPEKTELVAVRSGAAPVVLAEGATLVAAAAGRVAYVTAGKLSSAKLDGSDVRPLGGDDGQDQVMEVRGDRLLLTLHAGGAGDVRVVRIDGSERADLGAPADDDRGIAFATDDRIVLAHGPAGHRVLAAAGVDGKGEVALTPADGDAQAVAIAPGGDVVFTDAAGALRAVAAAGGATRLLDAGAGTPVKSAKVAGGRVFFSGGSTGHALRTAKLDGSGATELCAEPTWLPFFSALTPGDRVVFYRALAGQLEGGRLYTVKLDGSDRRPLGEAVVNRDGTPFANAPEDQDFEAVTPSGRVVLEAEFEGIASHLLVSDGDPGARRLADQGNVKFAAIVGD